jgi:hypothetical protein
MSGHPEFFRRLPTAKSSIPELAETSSEGTQLDGNLQIWPIQRFFYSRLYLPQHYTYKAVLALATTLGSTVFVTAQSLIQNRFDPSAPALADARL